MRGCPPAAQRRLQGASVLNELTSDRYWIYFTAIIYWALVVCWLAIVVFYYRQYGRFKQIYPLLTTLLIVLMIDGTRTLIESVYFGTRYISQMGIMWPELYRKLFEKFLAHGLKAAGAKAKLFADSVIELLFRASRGIPRRVSHLVREALMLAHEQDKNFVDDAVMEAILDDEEMT